MLSYHVDPSQSRTDVDDACSSRGGFEVRKQRLRDVHGAIVVGVNALHGMFVRIIQMQHCSIVDLGKELDDQAVMQ